MPNAFYFCVFPTNEDLNFVIVIGINNFVGFCLISQGLRKYLLAQSRFFIDIKNKAGISLKM